MSLWLANKFKNLCKRNCTMPEDNITFKRTKSKFLFLTALPSWSLVLTDNRYSVEACWGKKGLVNLKNFIFKRMGTSVASLLPYSDLNSPAIIITSLFTHSARSKQILITCHMLVRTSMKWRYWGQVANLCGLCHWPLPEDPTCDFSWL